MDRDNNKTAGRKDNPVGPRGKAPGRTDKAAGRKDKFAGASSKPAGPRGKAASPNDRTTGAKGKAAAQKGKPSKITLRVGETVTMDVNRLGINGEGIGYVERQVVFVDGALPGEQVVARISRVEPNFARADLLRIAKKSPSRVKPACPVYDVCGGCSLQHLEYQAQLDWKRELVRESFARYTGLRDLEIKPAIGMDNPWEYRNKAQLPVAIVGEKVIAGLYTPASHKLIDVSACAVQHPTTNMIIKIVRDTLEELQIPIYNEKKHTGLVRTIVPRIGFETGEVQLTLVTRTEEFPRKQEFVEMLLQRIPELSSINQNINPGRTSLIFGDKTLTLWGKEKIEEQLGDVRFALSPRAFFQLNPEQTKKLYSIVEKAAGLSGTEVVVDAYCGVGTIGLWLAPKAKEVWGIDVIPEAIADARDNAERSGIKNARFEVGLAEKLLVERVKKGFRPDVVVVDPPRTGLADALLTSLLKARPLRIVYVSCNPSTLAKDCAVLKDAYEIRSVQPIDMFPQTAHVESCTLLELRH